MKILITGGSGFVGKYFYNKLNKHDITNIDLKNGKDCIDFFQNNKNIYDLIIHCAAIVGGRENIDNNPLGIAKNLSIDYEMFNWAIRTKQKRIVYFSSSAAYPIDLQKLSDKNVLKESDIDLKNIKEPDKTYGWAKINGEYLAEIARSMGVKVHVLRPFSGYGLGQSLEYPFPSIMKRAKEKYDPFEIWGNGDQTRDFIHIDDIFNATMFFVNNDINISINLGTGVATSFKDLATLACLEYGYKPNFKFLINKPEGVEYRVSDNGELFKYYKPKIDLSTGIKMYASGLG